MGDGNGTVDLSFDGYGKRWRMPKVSPNSRVPGMVIIYRPAMREWGLMGLTRELWFGSSPLALFSSLSVSVLSECVA